MTRLAIVSGGLRQPSSTTTARCVDATEVSTVSSSSGRSTRRSTTSASMPSSERASAASSVFCRLPP